MDGVAEFLNATLGQVQVGVSILAAIAGLGSLVKTMRIFIKKSATKKDDAFLASIEAVKPVKWIMDLLEKFSVVKEKD